MGGTVRAGIVTDVEVNAPPIAGDAHSTFADASAPSVWALAWFVFAVIMLFFVL